MGAWRHLPDQDQTHLRIEWLSDEALDTSAIEGEILDRASVQSSIRRQFGLIGDRRRVTPAEAGVAEMMVALCRTFASPGSRNAVDLAPDADARSIPSKMETAALAAPWPNKALAQSLGEPSLIALSRVIARRRTAYYDMLEAASRLLDITD